MFDWVSPVLQKLDDEWGYSDIEYEYDSAAGRLRLFFDFEPEKRSLVQVCVTKEDSRLEQEIIEDTAVLLGCSLDDLFERKLRLKTDSMGEQEAQWVPAVLALLEKRGYANIKYESRPERDEFCISCSDKEGIWDCVRGGTRGGKLGRLPEPTLAQLGPDKIVKALVDRQEGI